MPAEKRSPRSLPRCPVQVQVCRSPRRTRPGRKLDDAATDRMPARRDRDGGITGDPPQGRTSAVGRRLRVTSDVDSARIVPLLTAATEEPVPGTENRAVLRRPIPLPGYPCSSSSAGFPVPVPREPNPGYSVLPGASARRERPWCRCRGPWGRPVSVAWQPVPRAPQEPSGCLGNPVLRVPSIHQATDGLLVWVRPVF